MITNEQHEARKLGIGGSDMPIILGLSSYKTPYQLYLEKTGQIESSFEETPVQYWGNQLEQIIREEFEKIHNVKVVVPDTIIHPDFPYLLGHLDGFIPEMNAVLEVKCSHQFMAKEWGDVESDVIPMQYLVQVAHYCIMTNADCAYIAVLIGGNDYREYKYIRDAELEQYIMKAAKTFWDCIQSRNPPEPINQVDLRLMFPTHAPDKVTTIEPTIAKELNTLHNVRLKIKELTKDEERYKFNIMQFMKDSECLVDETGKHLVSWKANKRGSRTFLMKGI